MSDGFEKIKLTDIKPAEYNPRVMDLTEFNKLSKSINEYGLVDPIIVNLKNMKIIGGHQRYDVIVDEYENNHNPLYEELLLLRRGDIGWVFTDNLLTVKNESYEKGLNIALNKISGEWDYPKLNVLLDELMYDTDFELNLTGFDNLDLNAFGEELDNIDLGVEGMSNGGNGTGFGLPKATLIVDSEDQEEIENLYNRLTEEGYDCRIK